MKRFNHLLLKTLTLVLVISTSGWAQFDDLYFDHRTDALPVTSTVQNQPRSNQNTYVDEYAYTEYDDEIYEDYDYSYSNRIRRFHAPARVVNYNSFNSWYDDFYYDPFYPSNGINVFIGSPIVRPWGWNSWNVGMGWNSWNTGWGWNSWNRPWGWNSWNNGWGWNSWNTGWGWNSCPPAWGFNNNFYGNVYYGNNWNNGNNWNGNGWNNNGGWNSGNNNSNAVYGSRRGGSVSSSTEGRNASPRREVISGGNGTGPVQTDANPGSGNSISPNRIGAADRSGIYKGDIQKSDDVSGRNSDAQRSSIYRRPADNNTNASPQRNNEPSRSANTTPSTRQNNQSRRSGNDAGATPNTRSTQPSSTPNRSSRGGGIDTGSSQRSNSGFNSGSSNRSSSGNSSGSSMRSSGSSSSGSSSRGGGGGSRRGGG
ncbi:MAG: hypothetical protein IPM42_09360 [Saprospiraceae bacterium]|nr:hypothetical protein [Saprospiraceae bacterium]